ncbi:ABC transporter ATP-binding protein [Phytoactinopolyspora limicola]|uniref:ABC transporter ATP-binding protein n=1 Tax=Phytoactinopolyspora limicola TaxID=2715536 RepID=UPI00140AF515|nr:ABC transporter ATP-binding protein [Phytoactinopolyspora limicola]
MKTAASVRPLVRIVRTYRRLLLGAVVSGIVDQGLAVAGAAVGAWLVGAAITGASPDELRPGLIVLALLVLPRAAVGWLESYLAHDMAFRALVDIREQVYRGFERQAPSPQAGRRSGDLVSTAMDDVERLEVFFAHTLSPLVVAVIVPTGSLVALWFIHPALAVALLPVAALVASIPAWLRRRAERQGHALRATLGVVNAEAVDGVQGLREIVAFNGQHTFLDRLDARTADLHDAQLAHGARTGAERAATDALIALGVIVALATAAALVSAGSVPSSLYPTAVVLAGAALAPVGKLGDAGREIGIVIAASDRVFAVIDAPATVPDEGTQPPPEPGPAGPHLGLGFRQVSFRYAANLPPAVQDVTFDVAPGETVALVGHSGAGKSTLAHLLMRFWDVDSGSIRIRDVDVRDLPQRTLRQLVAFVPQDVHLLNSSVAENIALARPGAGQADIERVAHAALAHDFIVDELPDGYDTRVGEWGGRLSGGQRQRIAIARALLRDAPILVMDEPVSNLDASSEHALRLAMSRVRAGRTTVLVAHRMSTIRTADRLVVLHQGRVAEIGTHDELLATGGVYSRLVAPQAGAPDRVLRGSTSEKEVTRHDP